VPWRASQCWCKVASLALTGDNPIEMITTRFTKQAEARELLAPICGSFTEGFDTLDLKEAKAVLDKLAPEGGDPHQPKRISVVGGTLNIQWKAEAE
jgi:hypothetical protein